MAKVFNPYGLRPVRRVDGLPYAGQIRHLPIASGYSETILTGDLVAIGADGTIEKVTGTTSLPAGTVGIFMGVTLHTGGPHAVAFPFSPSWAGGTVEANAMAHVVDDPGVSILIQADGPITRDMLGSNFGIVHPDDEEDEPYEGYVRPFSGIALDASSSATTATLPFKLIDFWPGPQNAPGDEFTDVIVKFNPGSHAYLTNTGV